jgi:hypothetical protein
MGIGNVDYGLGVWAGPVCGWVEHTLREIWYRTALKECEKEQEGTEAGKHNIYDVLLGSLLGVS